MLRAGNLTSPAEIGAAALAAATNKKMLKTAMILFHDELFEIFLLSSTIEIMRRVHKTRLVKVFILGKKYLARITK